MRTTVTLDDSLYRRAKIKAVQEGKTFSALVAEAVAEKVDDPGEKDFKFIVSGNKGGLAPGFSLERMAELLDYLDEEDARP